MTDRLRALLHEQADRLAIPSPTTHHTIVAGKRLRRRSRSLGAVSTLSMAAVAAVVLLKVLDNSPQASDPPIARDPAIKAVPAAYAVGSEVYLGDMVATVPNTVHSLHYTSVGVLVRSNPNDGASDGSGPENLTLVRVDGSTVDLGVIPEGVGPATDPGESVYALARATDTGFEAVLREATTGDVVKTLPLPDLPPSYWPVTPLSLSGDTLFAHFESSMAAVSIETGESRIVPEAPGGHFGVAGLHFVNGLGRNAVVYDAVSGATLLEVKVKGGGYFQLSPDGRFALLYRQPESESGGIEPYTALEVYDVANGTSQSLDPGAWQWGWTGSSDLFTLNGSDLTVCRPDTGVCETTPAPAAVTKKTQVKMGGETYES